MEMYSGDCVESGLKQDWQSLRDQTNPNLCLDAVVIQMLLNNHAGSSNPVTETREPGRLSTETEGISTRVRLYLSVFLLVPSQFLWQALGHASVRRQLRGLAIFGRPRLCVQMVDRQIDG